MNPGIHKGIGICVELEKYVGRRLLLLGCRHHIFELACGASCAEVYGETKSPEESIFKILQNNWSSINTDDYKILNMSALPRFIRSHLEEVLLFLESWVATSQAKSLQLRKDYLELAVLSIILLGGTLPKGMTTSIHAPGATTHFRWMNKILYTIKFSLFSHQLSNLKLIETAKLKDIQALAIFLIVYHVKAWLTCTNPENSPVNDLELYKTLLFDIDVMKSMNASALLPSHFLQLAEKYLLKLDCHLWYISERLCVLALFSSKLSLADKKNMARALLKIKIVTNLNADQNTPKITLNTHMKDLVGPDSWTFFSLLGISTNFLKLDPKDWSDSIEYQEGKARVEELVVVNDACERALGLITEFNKNRVTKDPEQKQYLYQVTRHLRKQQAEQATSSERCTKKSMKKYLC